MDLLARIWAVAKDFPWESDNEVDIESQERSIASWDLLSLQNMIHTPERQLEDRESRHAKHLAQFNQEVIGNIARQERFLVQLQQQKAKGEEVLIQVEQKIAERKARREKFLAQFERIIAEKTTLHESLLSIAKERAAEVMAQDHSNLVRLEEQEEGEDVTTN